MHELILGGAKSGKSRTAEARASQWLATPGHSACLLATAWAGDAEMAARIARHQADRAARARGLQTLEVRASLGALLRAHSRPDHLLVVDCLTLWLCQLMMPPPGEAAGDVEAEVAALLAAMDAAPGPVVCVSNEIGLGVLPLGREARAAVDRLGALHQQVAARCQRLTLMVAGHELRVKG